MSVLDKITDDNVWQEFLKYKLDKNLVDDREKELLTDYINGKKYSDIAEQIVTGEYTFSLPVKHLVNKIDKNKKRVVYTFGQDETMVLKLVCFLLYKYDYKLMPNCYSFRKNIGVKQAVSCLADNKEIRDYYCYKVDISNYFNSIPIEKLMIKLKDFIDDEKLYKFLENILENRKALYQNEIIEEDKGVMAGIPISPFLANAYLIDVDRYFHDKNIVYARYSDDIIMFCNENEFEENTGILRQMICEHGLKLNKDKEAVFEPHSEWSFLGFSFRDNVVDLSNTTVKKMQGKIRRASRKIRRWMLKKNVSADKAILVMNRKFNSKFYDYNNGRDLTWSRWFFPIINNVEGLEKIDSYMQQYLRYLVTGKHNKKNYEKVPYEMIKRCGYRPLVSEYYKKRDEI